MDYFEINFDGLVGNTHHYGGLADGNLASQINKNQISHPKQAALEGLKKMKFLSDLGLKQAVLPPHERPFIPYLKKNGYRGSAKEIIAQCSLENRNLLSSLSSSASMWVANAATVTPSTDSSDGLVHFTIANMKSQLHRSIESNCNVRVFKKIFSNQRYFKVHGFLKVKDAWDEGAANHMRLFQGDADAGLNIFVYGKSDNKSVYQARQSRLASEKIINNHKISRGHSCLIQQNPMAIDGGVFHNDVIATSHKNVLLYHSDAWLDSAKIIGCVTKYFENKNNVKAYMIEVKRSDMNIDQAVQSYLFNSQIVSVNHEQMILIADKRCEKMESVKKIIDNIIASENPISKVHYVNVEQSMKNGGGPACLRLRVLLNRDEMNAISGNVLLTDKLYLELASWVRKYYRDDLSEHDLSDPLLYKENCESLQALTEILQLGKVYSFQN